MTEAPPPAPTTAQDVNNFCNDARTLAATINTFCDRWQTFMEGHQPPLTARSRRKIELSLMLLESALERLR